MAKTRTLCAVFATQSTWIRRSTLMLAVGLTRRPRANTGSRSRVLAKDFFSAARSIIKEHIIGRDAKQSVESIKRHALQEFTPGVLWGG